MRIQITLKNYRCFPSESPAQFEISKGFTAFVGINNSGKSSLLRFFYEFRDLLQRLSSVGAGDVPNGLSSASAFGYANCVKDPEELFCNQNERGLEFEIEILDPPSNLNGRNVPYISRVTCVIPRPQTNFSLSIFVAGKRIGPKPGFHWTNGNDLALEAAAVGDYELMAKAFSFLARTHYIASFRNAVNAGGGANLYDIQVGENFVKTWKVHKTGHSKKAAQAVHNLSKQIRDLFGFKELEITPAQDEKTLQVIIDGRVYRLDELGSGVAQFILVLANAAIQRPSIILIDEPELNLHPALQAPFLVALASHAMEGQVLFSTHNYGLARATGDLVYTVSRTREGVSTVHPLHGTTRLSEFLGELGYQGYRDLGFERVLLVEGITDVKPVQRLLSLYHNETRFLVLQLGGRQMINGKREEELTEVARIAPKVAVLIDSEKASEHDPLPRGRADFVAICQRLGFQTHVLQRRAIENYLAESKIKEIFGEQYNGLQLFQKLSDVTPHWGKTDNWRIASRMVQKDLEGTDLESFLRSLA